MRATVIVLSLCFVSQPLLARKLCEHFLSEFVYRMQKGSLGHEEDPLASALLEYRKRHPDTPFTKGDPADDAAWKSEFHEDVVNFLIRELPGERWTYFQEKYGMTHEQALDVLTYYASRHYFNAVSYLGSPREIFGRLSQVSRQHRLGEPQNDSARTYPFYLYNVTRLSVPEMAARLSAARQKPVNEHGVYDELASLGISIEREFSQSLSPSQRQTARERLTEDGYPALARDLPDDSVTAAATYLAEHGLPTPAIARTLGIGSQALAFVQHYLLETKRNITWTRREEFEGEKRSEQNILELLWAREKSSQAIADSLNELFRTPPDSRFFRTSGSVTGKARALGLTDRYAKGPDFDLPGYGKAKEKGNLVPETVIPYLYDHHDLPRARLAANLQVTSVALGQFMRRHDVVLTISRPSSALPLSDVERAQFVNPDLGILKQLNQNRRGFATRSDEVMEALLREQVPDPDVQEDALIKLRAVGILALDGSNAKSGFKLPQDRIHEGLRIIAGAKLGSTPSKITDQVEGSRYFGFAPIKNVTSAPVLDDASRAEISDEAEGILNQLKENRYGFANKTDEVMEALLREQVTDPDRREESLKRLRALGIVPRDGGQALEGNRTAQNRIAEGLLRIAEGKLGTRPEKLTQQSDGTRYFGFAPIRKATKPPALSEAQRGEMLDPSTGILRQLAKSTVGFSGRTDEVLEALLRKRVTDPTRLEAALKKVHALGIASGDGGQALLGIKLCQDRIAEALRLIVEGETGTRPDKITTDEDGARYFGFAKK